MDKLLAYLNSLSKDDQDAFAKRCGTSVGYLRKACSINQRLGAELCSAIERESGGAVTRKHLRPIDWKLVWPELQKKAA